MGTVPVFNFCDLYQIIDIGEDLFLQKRLLPPLLILSLNMSTHF